MSEQEEKLTEVEQVTVKMPKPIMAFLRFQAAQQDMQVEEKIEYELLDSVRAEMEGFEGEELIAMLGVGSLFYKVLGDERYKPAEPEAKTAQI